MKKNFLILFCLCIISKISLGQIFLDSNYIGHIISLKGGLSYIGIIDEKTYYDKYNGITPFFAIGWQNISDKKLFDLDFSYLKSDKIKHYSSNAKIKNVSLNICNSFKIKSFQLMNCKTNIYLGPIFDAFYIKRNQSDKLSSGFLFETFSTKGLISLGINGILSCHINQKLQLKYSINSTALSILKANDGTNLIGLNKALHLYSEVSILNHIFNNIYIGIVYRFDYFNNRHNYDTKVGEDNISFNINFKL